MSASDPASPFGAALRRFRTARRLSQLDLALSCEVSARHLSFLESGRAQPSRDMVLHLGAGLLLPLSAQNILLQSAGYAPVFPASPLDSEALGPFRQILNEMMARHSPNPALLVDRHWTVREANPTALALFSLLQDDPPEMNVVRLLATQPRAQGAIANLPEVLDELSSRLRLEAMEAGDDAEFAELVALLDAACAHHAPSAARGRRPVLPIAINAPAGQWKFLSVIAHFGTSEDVTVRDMRLELFFPADDETRAAMTELARRAAA